MSLLLKRALNISALAALAVCAVLLVWRLSLLDHSPSFSTAISLSGGALLYGLPGAAAFNAMPLNSLVIGLMDSNLACRFMCLLPASLLVCLTLSFALKAARAGSFAILGVGIALFLFLPHAALVAAYDAEQAMYGVTIILFALALAEESLHRSLRSRLLAGCCFALAISVRSPLMLFMPLLLCWRFLRLRAWRNWADFAVSHVLPLLGPALLFLCCWWGASFAALGRFLPLEEGRAVSNVLSGAMGFVGTIEGNPYYLAGISKGVNPYLWALTHVLEHPWQYGYAVWQRLGVAFSIGPCTAFLAILFSVFFRANPFFRAAGLVSAYFLAVHCAMAVEARYFRALFPLLSAVALAGVLKVADRLSPFAGEKSWCEAVAEWGGRLALAVCALGLAASFVLLFAFPARCKAWGAEGYMAALASRKSGGYFYAFWAASSLADGKPAVAARLYARAAFLSPLKGYERDFLWSSLLARPDGFLSAGTAALLASGDGRGELAVAAASVMRGDEAAAVESLGAWARKISGAAWVFRGDGFGGHNAAELSAMVRARSRSAPDDSADLFSLANALPESGRGSLLSALSKSSVRLPAEAESALRHITPEIYLNRAAAALTGGDRRQARLLLSRAVAVGEPDGYVLVRAAIMRMDLGDFAEAEKEFLAAYKLDVRASGPALSLVNFYALRGRKDKVSRYCAEADANGLLEWSEFASSCGKTK